jgi:succinate dehydrogenase / fumarate reductase flavoprotein subunit
LLDGQVFGKIASHQAALEAKSFKQRLEVSPNQIKGYLAKLKRMEKGKKASEVRDDVQCLTSQFANVVRTEEGLRQGLKMLGALRKEGISIDEKGAEFAIETENIRDVAEMVLRACLFRKESRGPHLFFKHFEDTHPLPSQDPAWRKYVVIKNQSGRMILKKRTPIGINGEGEMGRGGDREMRRKQIRVPRKVTLHNPVRNKRKGCRP